jgi:hypothetical protein
MRCHGGDMVLDENQVEKKWCHRCLRHAPCLTVNDQVNRSLFCVRSGSFPVFVGAVKVGPLSLPRCSCHFPTVFLFSFLFSFPFPFSISVFRFISLSISILTKE